MNYILYKHIFELGILLYNTACGMACTYKQTTFRVLNIIYYLKGTEISNIEVWKCFGNWQHHSSCLMINLEYLGLEGLRRDENQHDHSNCLMIDLDPLGFEGWKWILKYCLAACCYLDIATLGNTTRLRWYAL